MDELELGFYVPFNSISVISGRWKGEHERFCAMKRRFGSGRVSPPASTLYGSVVSVVIFYIFWSFGTVGFNTFIWEQRIAQPGARRREGWRICHYLS